MKQVYSYSTNLYPSLQLTTTDKLFLSLILEVVNALRRWATWSQLGQQSLTGMRSFMTKAG